ncbi:hypothetical protein TNCV_4986431 [Trichonephila clavipes]|nr:hypothetical protein TNCV_4986431 [Trichonephila clavipes]
MQYHGVGRHHDQYAPTCGCEWDYDGPTEVLLPHVRLFRGAVGDKFVFMDDNATCHRTLAVQDCLSARQVAGRNYPPTNKNTLIRALTEWDKLLLDNRPENIDVWNVANSTVDISRLYRCLLTDALFHFSVRRPNEHFFFFRCFNFVLRTINILYL